MGKERISRDEIIDHVSRRLGMTEQPDANLHALIQFMQNETEREALATVLDAHHRRNPVRIGVVEGEWIRNPQKYLAIQTEMVKEMMKFSEAQHVMKELEKILGEKLVDNYKSLKDEGVINDEDIDVQRTFIREPLPADRKTEKGKYHIQLIPILEYDPSIGFGRRGSTNYNLPKISMDPLIHFDFEEENGQKYRLTIPFSNFLRGVWAQEEIRIVVERLWQSIDQTLVMKFIRAWAIYREIQQQREIQELKDPPSRETLLVSYMYFVQYIEEIFNFLFQPHPQSDLTSRAVVNRRKFNLLSLLSLEGDENAQMEKLEEILKSRKVPYHLIPEAFNAEQRRQQEELLQVGHVCLDDLAVWKQQERASFSVAPDKKLLLSISGASSSIF